ncbi:MAG: protein-disulfide reductase DsbD domain-containing protein [Candidatus Scalinduaceae bacterium]
MLYLSLAITASLVSSANLASASLSYNHTKADLISEVKSLKPGKPFWVAVRLTMDKDWHTYWRNPGDSGLSTKIKWTLPEGFVAGETQWPYPHKFKFDGIVSFGYKDEVCLLTKIRPAKSIEHGGSVSISVKVEWLECKNVCLTGLADLTLELPVKDVEPEIDSQWIKQFEAARRNLPLSPSGWKISAMSSKSGFILQLTPSPGLVSKPTEIFFFPEKSKIIDHATVQEASRTEAGHVLRLKKSAYALEPTKRLRGVLVSSTGWLGLDSERALQIDVPVQYD